MKLSPCGHLAVDKENIIGKSETLFTHLFLTEINSRQYGLSLLRTRNRVPDGVRNNGSWLYERSVFYGLMMFWNLQNLLVGSDKQAAIEKPVLQHISAV